MNFNISEAPEYDLNTQMIDELINLYGVSTKFLVIERINKDDAVFGDFSHIKTDSEKIFEMYMLPEITEDWDQSDFSFSQFGIVNTENISLFAAFSQFDEIFDGEVQHIMGNLIVLPNNKVMEITNVSFEVPGINNLFTYKDTKSVVKITCKPYDFKLINEVDNVDISTEEEGSYDTLDTYFAELIDEKDTQDNEAEVIPSVVTNENNVKVEKPIVDRSEDDVWGSF
jgi:hypothetical protein